MMDVLKADNTEAAQEVFSRPVYERVILSYCCRSVDNFYNVFSNINSGDFLCIEHKLLWMIMSTLFESGVNKIDDLMLINVAQKEGVMKQVGGFEYIAAIMLMEFEKDNIQFYIDKVLNASTKFQLYNRLKSNLRNVKKSSKDDDIVSSELIGQASADVMDLDISSKSTKEPINLSEGLDEYIEERKDNPISYCGISTGFDILDKRIDGLIPKTLTILCARPKHGKSTFLSTVAAHVAYKLQKSVLFVDTEMPFEEFRPRIISMLSGVPERTVKHGGYSGDQYRNIQQAIKIIKSGNLYHEYLPGYTIDRLKALYKKYKFKENIGLAIFDYIKAPSESDFKSKKEYQLLGDVTTSLKDISGALDIPVLAANQINRQEDIADSDRILRYADVVMFFKPKTQTEIEDCGVRGGTYRLIIRHSRRGGTTPDEGISYRFYKKCLQIEEAETQVIDYDSKELKEREEFDIEDSIEDSIDEPIDAQNF